jgi:hypothetical protein
MLHATSGPRFATKSLLRSFVANEPLTENFDGNRTINQQVRGAVDRSHSATTKPFIQPVLLIENAVQQWIGGNIGNRSVGLERRLIGRTHEYVIGKTATASGTLEH